MKEEEPLGLSARTLWLAEEAWEWRKLHKQHEVVRLIRKKNHPARCDSAAFQRGMKRCDTSFAFRVSSIIVHLVPIYLDGSLGPDRRRHRRASRLHSVVPRLVWRALYEILCRTFNVFPENIMNDQTENIQYNENKTHRRAKGASSAARHRFALKSFCSFEWPFDGLMDFQLVCVSLWSLCHCFGLIVLSVFYC